MIDYTSYFKRTRLAGSLLFVLIFAAGCGLVDKLGGDFSINPGNTDLKLSDGARQLIERSYNELSPEQFVDYHLHIVGIQKDKTGCFVNEKMKSWLYPFRKMRYSIYLSAAGVRGDDDIDVQYISRIVKLTKSEPLHGKYIILALDKFYNEKGIVDEEKTQFYVPNEYVYKIAMKNRDVFIPAVSIHPYRQDALEELDKWARKDVRFVKWIPNSMGIDLSSDRIVPFYKKMKEYNMVLLCHTGDEAAVDADSGQKFGNPLLLRKPLDIGVKIIAAHCASLGQNIDLDSKNGKLADNFDLFMRLMNEKKYKGLLYGEISAITHFNRMGKPLLALLERKDLHDRLLYGSDYPLPAVNLVIQTKKLQKEGFITSSEMDYLNEIYKYNPLLFDFVLKKTIRHPLLKNGFSGNLFSRKIL